ncbi:hypothetical protein JCM3770_005895 [Rhodotorula araucariae]
MAAPSLLLLVLAHTLLLSLLPVLLLQLRRLCRAQTHVRSALIAASTLCVGLYGVCALVALAGTSKDEGRVASVVAGTHGCGGVLISAFTSSSSCHKCFHAPFPAPLPLTPRPKVGLVLLQLLGVALDIITIASPLRVNYTPLAGGGRSTPTLFGTTSRSSTYVVVASITWLRWAGTLCLATGK